MYNSEGLTMEKSEDAGRVITDAGDTPVIKETTSTVLDTEPSVDEDGARFSSTWFMFCIFIYVITCFIWPEIPVAFLALVTSAGLLGVFDKASGTNVSSQTSKTNQSCESTGLVDNAEADHRDIAVQISNCAHMEGAGNTESELCRKTSLFERNNNHEANSDKQSQGQTRQNLSSDDYQVKTLTDSTEIDDESNGKRYPTQRSPVGKKDLSESHNHEPQGDGCKHRSPQSSNCRGGELFFITTSREVSRRKEKPALSSSLRPKKSKFPSKGSASLSKPRLRESCSEIVAGRSNRKEIPVFAKVWRIAEPEVKQTVFASGNVGDNISIESDASDRLSPMESPYGSSSRSSDDTRIIANFNDFDRNLNCYDCQSSEDTNKADFLSVPITAWLENMQINSDNPNNDIAEDNNHITNSVRRSSSLPVYILPDQTHFCDGPGTQKELGKTLKPDTCFDDLGSCQTKSSSFRESQTQTVLFSDILRINVKKFLQAETRQFHKRRNKLRFKYARELGKLKHELTGKNRILSTLQLKIPALGEEIQHLRMEKNELECELEEEKSKTDNLMDRLTAVYQKLMLIDTTRQVQLQDQLQQQQMHEQLQQYQLEKHLRQQYPEQQFQEQLNVHEQLQPHNVVQELLQQHSIIPDQFQQHSLIPDQFQQHSLISDQFQQHNLIQEQFQQQEFTQEQLNQQNLLQEQL